MSENHRPSAALADIIDQMDSAVNDIRSWARAFQAVGASHNQIDEGSVSVMADALADRAADLKLHFDQAFAIVYPGK